MKIIRKVIIGIVILIGIFVGWYQSRTVFDTFASIYELNGWEINRVRLMTYTDFSLLRDSPPKQMSVVDVTNQAFESFYNYLLTLEVDKVEPRKAITIDHHANYEFSVVLNKGTETEDLHFEIGKYYIVVIGDEVPNSNMYKHNLSEEKYKDIISKLKESLDLD